MVGNDLFFRDGMNIPPAKDQLFPTNGRFLILSHTNLSAGFSLDRQGEMGTSPFCETHKRRVPDRLR